MTELFRKLPGKSKLITSDVLRVIFMLASLASCLNITYQVCFQDHTHVHFAVSYFLDVVHLVKIYCGFVTPFRSASGVLVTRKKCIMLR